MAHLFLVLLIILLLVFVSHILKFKTTKKLLLSWLIFSVFFMFLGENSFNNLSIFHFFMFSFGFIFATFGKWLFVFVLVFFWVWR